MSLLVRRLFFWILVLTFLATAPAIILFLMGYRYSFERGVFVYTGSISIQTNPSQNLDIRVDGEPVSSETNRINRSYHIEGVKPGTHALSVSAPGFTRWSKEITVRSGVSTEFWNILLAREQYGQSTVLAPEGTLAFFSSLETNETIFLSQKNGETLITVLDTESGNRRQLFSTIEFSPDPKHPDIALRQSPSNTALFLATFTHTNTGEEHTFLIHTETGNAVDLKDIVRVPLPRDVRWNPENGSLFFLSGNVLFELSTDAPLQEKSLSENIESYDLVDNTIVALEPKTGILFSFPARNPDRKTQITTAPPEDFNGNFATPFSLVAYDKTRVAAIHRETGDLFLYNKGEEREWFKKLSSDAAGFQFSDDGKKFLFWTDWEIFTVFTRKWEVQPVRNEGDRLDIERFSSAIDHVQWSKDYEHIIFSIERNIKITELDDRGGRNTTSIIALPASPLQVTGLGSQDKLTFLLPAREGDTVTSPTLSTITFPEPIGLFGFGG
jgi:hypothetical protein